MGFRVGGRQYSWASFAGFGKPFWIDWWSDRTSWDSSPFRVWGSNTSSCQGDGGLSGGTFPEASHGRGCYPNNGRRNSLEPVAGQSSGWERSCRARVENFGLRGKQAHRGVHASAFGGARVPIEGPEEPSRQHGCHALYYPRRILLPELPAGTSGLQRPSWRAGGKDAPATSQRVGKGGGPSLEDFGSLGGLPNGRCEEKGRREKGPEGGSSLLKIGHGKGGGLGLCPFALDVRLFVGRGSLHFSIGNRGDEPCRRSAGWEDVEVSRGYGGLLFEGLAGVIQYWPCGRSRASLFRGPGGNLGAPFAQESGGGVNGTVGGPGDGHCRRFQSPAGSEPIGVPGLWSSSSSSCPEALPAANATPGSGGGSFGSIERASNGNGSSNGIGSFNGNGPNRAREEFQVAGSFADPSLDIFSFGSGGDLREPYRECLPGFPNSGRRSKGSDPFGSRGPRRGEQRAGVTASRSEFLVKFPELTSGRSSGESSSIENFADVSFREHVLQHVCQHVLMHVWHGSCSEHVSWHDGCCVVQTPSRNTKQKARNLKKQQARNLKKQQAQNLKKPQAQNLKKPQAQNLLEPSSFRSGSGFTPGVDLGILVGILMIHSLLSGLLLWGFSGLLLMFRKVVSGKRRGRRYTVLPGSCGSYLRVRLRNRWVRVEVSRKLCFERVRKGFLQGFLDHVGMLSCFGMCDMVGMCGMFVGDDEPSPPGTAEKLTHSLRAVRGLPSPGSGTGTDPFVLDSEPSPNIEPRHRNPEDPEGLFEDDPFGEEPASGFHKKPKTPKGEPPPEDPKEPGDEDEDMRVPLTNLSLHRHRCQGHFPFDENCTSCCSSKGRVPARRLRRKLQRENQTIGLDFYYFGKLRVLLVMHLGSRYTLSLPAPELNDDLVYNVIRSIKECGLTGKAVTFRLDNEASLVSLVDRVGRSRSCPASAVITDVVAGYRPQSKGSIEKQVDVVKSGFWSVWLDLEAQITKALPEAPAEGVKLPLGGLLWQAAVFYTSRCYNLWCCSQDNSTTALDRLHEEFVQKTRTRPFGCVLQAKVSKSRAHLEKYRGARTVKIVYLGPVHARGGGIYGVPLGSKEIDVFPAAGLGKGGDVFDAGTLVELASEQPLIQDNQDPERPILFDPVEVGDVGEVFPDEGVDGDGDEEMIEDELADYSPSHAGDEDGPVIEGDGDGDMEVDWLANHLLESVLEGPELRASSSEISKSFNLKFGGSEITCQVPQHALAETSGELLRPDLRDVSYQLFCGDEILESAFEQRPDKLCVAKQLAELMRLPLQEVLSDFDAITGSRRHRKQVAGARHHAPRDPIILHLAPSPDVLRGLPGPPAGQVRACGQGAAGPGLHELERPRLLLQIRPHRREVRADRGPGPGQIPRREEARRNAGVQGLAGVGGRGRQRPLLRRGFGAGAEGAPGRGALPQGGHAEHERVAVPAAEGARRPGLRHLRLPRGPGSAAGLDEPAGAPLSRAAPGGRGERGLPSPS